MVSSSGATAKTAPSSGRRKRDLRRRWAQLRLKIHLTSRPVLLSVGVFLLTFVRWFDIPSPFAASLLLAFADKPSPVMLLGLGASLVLRLIWGIEADLWQFAGCLLLWLALQKCRPRNGVETAALGGLSMLPRIFAALANGTELSILLSCAALPFAMLFSAAMRFGTEAIAQKGAASRGSERFCVLLIGILAISGLGFFRIGAVNLGQMTAVAATAVLAHLTDPVYGAAGGMTCGVALVLAGHDSALAMPLGLIGMLCGLGEVKRRRWLILPSAAASAAISLVVSLNGQPAVSWGAALTGAGLFLMIPTARLERLKPWTKGFEIGSKSMENAFVSQRIAHMREAVEHLAKALPQCPAETAQPCLTSSGDSLVVRQQKNAAIRKARYERELTLTHLAALSGTLGELGTMAAGESFNDLRAAHVIGLAIEEIGMNARLSYARRVDGHLQAALECSTMMPVRKQLDHLLRVLAREEDLPLSISRAEKGWIELEEIPLYSASVGVAVLSADASKVCGDACTAKRCEGGRLLMMLCDGMGHGEEAHQQSEKTIELLLLLLEAGYTRRQAITAVNGMLLGSQQEERFSTVDLADVDLWTGEVASEKLGACASWVVRGNHMKKLEGSSLPLGILEEASATSSEYRLHSGDILILMSDGVADAFLDDDALEKALRDSLYIQPQRMADAIVRNALLALGGSPKDDMSVMVLLLMDRHNSIKA